MGQTRGERQEWWAKVARRERIRTATGLTRKEEVYVTSQGRRETWEVVAAMDDGRVIEVISMMRGGAKSEKKNNPEEERDQKAGSEEKVAEGVEMERKNTLQEVAI